MPTITSHRATSLQTAPERFWIPFRLSLPTVAPGQTPGALRFVSLALHILPQKGGRHRRNVSARKVSEPALHPETHFSIALLQVSVHYARRKTDSTQQAWMYSRNQTTIASACKHRQPVFLHPTRSARKSRVETPNPRKQICLQCKQILRCAQDFGCGLPLRSRPLQTDPSLRSGFRLRAPAALTPARRLTC